jgi:hypothetical protein
MKKIITILSCVALIAAIALLCGCAASFSPTPSHPASETFCAVDDLMAAPPVDEILFGEATTPTVDAETVPVKYCDFGYHEFCEPVITLHPDLLHLYYKEEVCDICGYMQKSLWAMYLPEGSGTLPTPGGEYDNYLYTVDTSDGSHLYPGCND